MFKRILSLGLALILSAICYVPSYAEELDEPVDAPVNTEYQHIDSIKTIDIRHGEILEQGLVDQNIQAVAVGHTILIQLKVRTIIKIHLFVSQSVEFILPVWQLIAIYQF